MVVSTGVGGGLVLNGRLHPGPTGNAGHIGHISVDLDGDPCPCGARGCVERIARRAQHRAARPGRRLAAGPGRRHLRRRGGRGGPPGRPRRRGLLRAGAQALAAGIAAAATLVEIDIAVVGGGVGKAGDVLFAPLRKALTDYATLSFVQRLAVVPAQMGTDAGLVGAAAAALTRTADARPARV